MLRRHLPLLLLALLALTGCPARSLVGTKVRKKK